MAWLFEHLPGNISRLALSSIEGLFLVNSIYCPKQKTRLCVNTREQCCLGNDLCRKSNKCRNKKTLEDKLCPVILNKSVKAPGPSS